MGWVDGYSQALMADQGDQGRPEPTGADNVLWQRFSPSFGKELLGGETPPPPPLPPRLCVDHFYAPLFVLLLYPCFVFYDTVCW